MKLHRLLPLVLVALAGLSLGSGCPTMPKLEERIVELAFGSTTTLGFRGHSIINTTWDTTGTYNLNTDINLHKLLQDAGVDAGSVTGIALSGVSYRVSVANAGSRLIQNGRVSVQRQGGGVVILINNFSQNVGAPTDFITAPLTSAGTAVLNQMLADILAAEQNGTPVVNPQITYIVHGDADGVPYDFRWELKLDISVKGKIKKIKVLT